jgi:geranylgeranyl reductase family protein
MNAAPVIGEAEIVVIGAGPAGSAAAATLAGYGDDVLIVDKESFPRDKPCGDGLTPTAVSALRRFGLAEMLESSPLIEGGRVVLDHAGEELKSYRDRHGHCVPRARLDQSMLDVAIDAGARLLTARVTSAVMDDEQVAGVEVSGAAQIRGQIRGRYFIAADGPNSALGHRFRRAGSRPTITCYAVRQYFDVERTLDQLFDIYVPITCQGRGVVGYGWVFPIGDHRANIGVGYYRSRGDTTVPSIRVVLADFLAELRTRQSKRFGELTPVGAVVGSPVATNFSHDSCQWRNLMFVGDAAGMTDPMTGEGIANALLGGEEAGRYLHGLSRATVPAPGGCGDILGDRLARVSVRLGQDMAMPIRVADRVLGETPDRARVMMAPGLRQMYAGQPALRSLCDFWEIDRVDRSLDAIDALPPVPGRDKLREALVRLDGRAFDYLRTTFPFAAEMIQRKFRKRDGRMRAIALYASSLACGGTPDAEETSFALAIELINIFPELLGLTVDRPEGTRDQLNNVLAVITGDYILTRALDLVKEVGTVRTSQLARAACAVCEGAVSEIAPEADPAERRAAAETRSATLYALACRLGAELAGAGSETAAALETYGERLGMALRASTYVYGLPDRDATEAMARRRAYAEHAKRSVAGAEGVLPDLLMPLAELAMRNPGRLPLSLMDEAG